MLLGDYLTGLRQLLHDPSDAEWNLPIKILYINEARKHVVKDLGCNRQILTNQQITAGQISYTYPSNVFQVYGIAVFWGTQRIPLVEISPARMDQLRSTSLMISMPAVYTKIETASIMIWPQPDQDYLADWRCNIVPADLQNVTGFDNEILIYPYTEPVLYYAAYKAYADDRIWADANQMQAQYFNSCRNIAGTAEAGMYRRR